MTNSPSTPAPSKLVVPKNVLKQKVGHGGFDQAKLEKAQHMIENNTIDFRPIAMDLLGKLDLVLNSAKEGVMSDKEVIAEAMYPIMQLKAQGGLFHYPSISNISQVMVDFLEVVTTINSASLEIIAAFKRAVHAVVVLQIKAGTEKDCQSICSALQGACNRYHKMISQA